MAHCEFHDADTLDEKPDVNATLAHPEISVYRCSFMAGWHLVTRTPDDDEG